MAKRSASPYYDWAETLTYDADVTFVIGARGIGKTYGLRKQFVKDWKKNGSRFVEICRYVDELADVANGYFDKLEEKREFPDLVFRTDKHRAYVAKKPKNDDEKPKWHTIGYFVALTRMQRSKKKTYAKVKRLLFDEGILDRRDRYHSYLPSEFSLLLNVVDSCTRENAANGEGASPHLYILGNAVDMANPYFARYGVKKVPPEGKSWHGGKTCLVDYVIDEGYAEGKLENTLAGRMAKGTLDEAMLAYNRFNGAEDASIAKKPPSARYIATLSCMGDEWSIWASMQDGLYYVSTRKPRSGGAVYALTTKDNEANLIVLQRAAPIMRTITEAVALGIVRYESIAMKKTFISALAPFGLR